MADIFSSEKRSEIMSNIKGKDTKPELIVRKALHAIGYRYSLHKKNLPGKPDLYFRKYNAAIEINGCYWHGHDCHRFSMPKTRREFWKEKIDKNRKRDQKNINKLRQQGIRVLIVWECALKGKSSLPPQVLICNIEEWLNSNQGFSLIRGYK